MDLYKKIRGIVGNTFQLQKDGAQLKNNAGVLESRNANDDGYAVFRAGTPVGEDDVVIKSYVRTNINSAIIQWSIIGPVSSTGITIDGLRFVPFNSDIEAIYVSLAERGNTGNTIIDINKGSPTLASPGDFDTNVALNSIYTTQANRPTLPGNNPTSGQNLILWSLQPDITSLNQGEVLSFDVDQKVSGARDLTCIVFLKKV